MTSGNVRQPDQSGAAGRPLNIAVERVAKVAELPIDDGNSPGWIKYQIVGLEVGSSYTVRFEDRTQSRSIPSVVMGWICTPSAEEKDRALGLTASHSSVVEFLLRRDRAPRDIN